MCLNILISKAIFIVHCVKTWFENNLLELKLNKTKYMYFKIQNNKNNNNNHKLYVHSSLYNLIIALIINHSSSLNLLEKPDNVDSIKYYKLHYIFYIEYL